MLALNLQNDFFIIPVTRAAYYHLRIFYSDHNLILLFSTRSSYIWPYLSVLQTPTAANNMYSQDK